MLGDCIVPQNIALDKDGYPRLKINQRYWRMNRWMWLKVYGEIPNGYIVAHKCNNPSCINSNHFYLATPAQNSTDAAQDNLYLSGERHPNFKQHLETKSLYERYINGETQQSIAKDVGISQSSLSQRFIRYKRKNPE